MKSYQAHDLCRLNGNLSVSKFDHSMDKSCHRSTCLTLISHFCHKIQRKSIEIHKNLCADATEMFLQFFLMHSMQTKLDFIEKITFFSKIVHEQPTHHLEIYTGKNNSLTVWPTRKPYDVFFQCAMPVTTAGNKWNECSRDICCIFVDFNLTFWCASKSCIAEWVSKQSIVKKC